jgi:uncharacterized protein YqgC (DUF456 family)
VARRSGLFGAGLALRLRRRLRGGRRLLVHGVVVVFGFLGLLKPLLGLLKLLLVGPALGVLINEVVERRVVEAAVADERGGGLG